ncbi:hypothetical protein GCM10022234_09960 [Aeromicrobium panaciterrae]|uniref:LPXTG cell wall anchor domain-containing protein n=1 Tax=Aeromicrobium panaciterrae TaxID=363861 RepID=UPI0031E460A0
MKKLRLAAVAALVSGFALFAAAPAQAYPDPAIRLTADSPVIGGNTVNFVADTAALKVPCDWTVTFTAGVANGENPVRTGSGTSLSGSFESKPVSKSTPVKMTAKCLYDNAVDYGVLAPVASGNDVTPAVFSASPARALPAAIVPVFDSVTVILLPKGGVAGEDGELPDTGGSNLSWLYIGGALVLAGAGVTYAARRRHSAR